jgi:Concanavalin A-like lectin/glucanases superfamily
MQFDGNGILLCRILARTSSGSTMPSSFYQWAANISWNWTGWNHVVWTITSTGQSIFYVNNASRYFNDETGSPPNYGSILPPYSYNKGLYNVNIGYHAETGYANYGDGKVDDFKIYSKTLSSIEISNLYNN